MTFKKNAFILSFIFLLTANALGQKIKYKDLFVLLNAKQYDQAEPFLKKYLKENQDNPNAFLYMGYIYEEKALANDVLRETVKQGTNSDSAALFFDRAFKTIDDRELRKNEEYYQAYSRRDLRTGKFGLKLSDVQFDLEKRIKALKSRQLQVKSLKDKFIETQRLYERCAIFYKTIADRYKNQMEFFLRTDDLLLSDLRRLAIRYDSCLVAFNNYKIALQGIGKTGHKQELDPTEINDFKKEGYSSVDFFQDELKFWDYKRWAIQSMDVMEKEVMPVMETLVKLDAELNDLREKIRKDSVSVNTQLSALAGKIRATGLKKFDANPLPNDVFKLKLIELEYGSELASTRNLRDSVDLALKNKLYKSQIALLARMDSVAGSLTMRDFDYEAENYKGFIKNAYGSLAVLRSLIKSTGDFAVVEKAEKERRVRNIEQALNWVYDQNDSIPATNQVTSIKYFPISIVPGRYTFGLTFIDSSAFAYFYAISPAHKATIKLNHKLDSAAFQKGNLPMIKGISATDGLRKEFYIIMYSEAKTADRVPSVIYKVSERAGLEWFNYFNLEGIPSEATISSGGELSFRLSLSSGSKVVVVQADGKMP